MKRDFLRELQAIVKRADRGAVIEPIAEKETVYNIHKRSLPPGLDRIVGIGFDKPGADKALRTLFKARVDTRHGGQIIYYEIIAQDATEKEKGLLFSSHQIVKEGVK